MTETMRIRKSLITLLACLCLLPARARTTETTNEPDSVYLLAYATRQDKGRSGLKFAWSADGTHWMHVGNGYAYLKCDYGAWGSEKRMIRPRLYRGDGPNTWHCVWQLNDEELEFAHTASADLLEWQRQTYFIRTQRPDIIEASQNVSLQQADVEGETQEGNVLRVAWTDVQRLNRYADHKAYRNRLHDERTEQDPQRFAGLSGVDMHLTIDATQRKPISEKLIGVFFEDINYGADGGLYAELIQNRDFEYSSRDRREWTSTTAWTLEGDGTTLRIDTVAPIHPNNPHYAVLDVRLPRASLTNSGYDGIVVRRGEKYDFSWMARSGDGHKGRVKVSLCTADGRELASATLRPGSRKWKKQTAVLTPSADADSALLVITPTEAGTYAFDMVSLFPRNTFHGRTNGLRADLAQAIADVHPRFVRFPGGCVAHGNGLENIYRWKNSIGPLEARKPMRNLWGYHQTLGLGYFEYFQFCEDIGAEPLPVLAAGVTCQNTSSRPGQLLSGGQQGGIPMDEMDEYVQDILDLIDYANADPKTNKWARMRAEAGHPAPFNLKYIGIGNEDLITDVFEERFTLIYEAIRKHHPDITVIGTAGPFYEGTDYEEGWALADRLKVPVVDEHYYNPPGWFIHNQDFYDRYDREKPKVYLGEYAAHLPGRPNNIETALAEALYLTAVERNGDIVTMTSYAPLLAKEGHTQWNPDLIYFNNREVKPTVGYYVQQLYGQNAGDILLASTVTTDSRREDVNKRIAVSAVTDSHTGDLIVKLVNLLPVEVRSSIALRGFGALRPTAVRTVLTGRPDDRRAHPATSTLETDGTEFPCLLPAYSFTVLRLSPQ